MFLTVTQIVSIALKVAVLQHNQSLHYSCNTRGEKSVFVRYYHNLRYFNIYTVIF